MIWFVNLTLALVHIPSVNGTADEVGFAERLHALLAERSYFSENPELVWRERIEGDPHGRENVYALVRGSGRATVMLTGHYDVVDIGNYGSLADWAFDPEALLPRLIAQLEQSGQSDANALALADLRSGDFLPGRGVLDMKSGLAIGIALQEHFARLGAHGNILLIATPDEEASSYGMRGVAQRLPTLIQDYALDPLAAINLDVTVGRGDGRDGQAIFLGSVGKVLPGVYIAGRETHAGAPFDGVNPNLLAAEITRRIECNVDLCDVAEGETTPPPVNLTQIDLKQHYDVTTPAAAWCAYNVLTHKRTAGQVLPIIQRLVDEALQETLSHLREQARRFEALSGQPVAHPIWQPQVYTFAELHSYALERGGAATAEALHALTSRLEQDPDVNIPQFSRRVIELLWAASGLSGPAAVLALASLYYPPVHVDRSSPRHVRLRESHRAPNGRRLRATPVCRSSYESSFQGSRI